MRFLKAAGSVIVLIGVTILAPVGLVIFGRLGGLAYLSPATLLRADDGSVLLGILTAAGWLAWLAWIVVLGIETAGRLTGRRWTAPGLGWAQAIVASLIVAVLAVGGGGRTAAHATVPAAASVVQVHDLSEPQGAFSSPPPVVAFGGDTAPAHMPTAASAGTYTVKAGDDLWSIADALLGDGLQWRAIVAANPIIKDPDYIEAGWQLSIPGMQPAADTPPTPKPPSPPATSEPAPPSTPTPPRAEPAPPVSGPTFAQTHTAGVAVATSQVSVDRTDAAVVGAGSLLAAGAVLALALLRRRQEFSRDLGQRFPHPGAAAQRAEVVLRASADLGAIHVLERAQRLIAAQRHGQDLPHVDRVHLSAEAVRFVFSDEPGPCPDGFSASGHEWSFDRARYDQTDAPAAPLAYPGLVSVGQHEGETLLVDLEQVGVLGVSGAGARDAIAAMVVELATAPWADELNLVTHDPLRGLVESGEFQVRVEPDASDAVVFSPLPPDARIRRLHPDEAPDLTPRLAFVTDELARLEPSPGVGVVMPSRTRPWRLDTDAGVLITPHGSTPLQAHTLPESAQEQLAHLFRAATAVEPETAPWWAHDPEPPGQASSSVPQPQRPQEPYVNDQPPRHPELLLLGPIELRGCAGTTPARATRQCIEYAAWLLENPGSTASQMAAALFVAEGTRRSNVCRLRAWLGSAADGSAYLPEAYSGRLALHPGVTSDWQRLQILIGAGVNRCGVDTLRAALSLVRGAPLADAAPSQWHWAEPMRSDMTALIRDIGARLAELALEEGNPDLARWATGRALVAAPEDELLVCLRIRTEHRAGNAAEVERLAWRLTRHARALGVELRDDTVVLLQEVMEGQVRARAVG